MAGAIEGDTFIGKKAQELRGLLKIKYPMEHGIIKDWDDMERIWQFVYSEELKILSEEVRVLTIASFLFETIKQAATKINTAVGFIKLIQHPVLLTEAPLNPRQNRETLAQIFFETFNVPALHISIQAVLSLYASGRTTGLVLDSGDGVTHAVPVYEGFALPHSIKRIDLAGRDVTDYLQVLLRKNSGVSLYTSSEKEIVRVLKEKCCYVALNPSKEEKDAGGVGGSAGGAGARYDEFVLPDGNVVKVSEIACFFCCKYIMDKV
jgi:centractin